MLNWLRGMFTGGAETPKSSSALQETIRAWENNETGINSEKRKAIYGDDGQLVEVVNVGSKKEPKFAISLNGQNHEIADLRDDLSRLIGKLQEQSPALQQWVITSVQMVNYQDGKTPKSCYFLSGYPLDETLPMILNDSPIQ